jgi:hypothetical protein
MSKRLLCCWPTWTSTLRARAAGALDDASVCHDLVLHVDLATRPALEPRPQQQAALVPVGGGGHDHVARFLERIVEHVIGFLPGDHGDDAQAGQPQHSAGGHDRDQEAPA